MTWQEQKQNILESINANQIRIPWYDAVVDGLDAAYLAGLEGQRKMLEGLVEEMENIFPEWLDEIKVGSEMPDDAGQAADEAMASAKRKVIKLLKSKIKYHGTKIKRNNF